LKDRLTNVTGTQTRLISCTLCKDLVEIKLEFVFLPSSEIKRKFNLPTVIEESRSWATC